MNFGLTPEQLKERQKYIGGSDAAYIIDGGVKWYELWLSKTGRAQPKAIMSEWDSALRHTTEILQLDWYEHKTGQQAGRRGEGVVSAEYPILRATLDGFDMVDQAVLQAKHVSNFTPDPINWCKAHYAAQVNHEMLVTGAKSAVLLIMVGMNEPVWVDFEYDPFFAEAYISRCKEFWEYVVTEKEPPGGPEPLPVPIPIEEMTEHDFTGNNEWASLAADWIFNKNPSKIFTDAGKSLKALVKPGIKRAYGHNIEIVRAKNGNLTIRELDQDEK